MAEIKVNKFEAIDAVKNWNNEKWFEDHPHVFLEDQIERHFDDSVTFDTDNISNEARRVMDIMFPEDGDEEGIEDDSPLGLFLKAIAVTTQEKTVAALADMLGIDDGFGLLLALKDHKAESGCTPIASLDELKRLVKLHD